MYRISLGICFSHRVSGSIFCPYLQYILSRSKARNACTVTSVCSRKALQFSCSSDSVVNRADSASVVREASCNIECCVFIPCCCYISICFSTYTSAYKSRFFAVYGNLARPCITCISSSGCILS